jgi:hypothetical protein
MNPLLEQLHDIEGLDAISAWPLAMGWWILIGIGIAFAIGAFCLIAYWITYKRSWKSDALKKLAHLERHLSEATARETLMILSEYLRRIVLRKYPRKECAGLTGENWLKWLAKHDPKQYDWEQKGQLLIKAPYAPAHVPLSPVQIKELIQAVKEWVR